MDKRKIKFKFIREGLNKFSIIKLPQESDKRHRDNYVFIDTNGKSCNPGFITAYFEGPNFNRGVRYIGNVLRYEKVIHSIFEFVSSSSKISTWYLLYYNFKHGGIEKTDLDIIWCFSKYRDIEEGEECRLETLDGLWKDMKRAAENYKAGKYNVSRIRHNKRYRR